MPKNTTRKEVARSASDGVRRPLTIHNWVHLFLLNVPALEVWDAAPPGGKVRTLSALTSHIHEVGLEPLTDEGDGVSAETARVGDENASPSPPQV